MDLPVDEWKSYLLQKWASLPKSIQVTISTAETLSDIFLHSSSLLHMSSELIHFCDPTGLANLSSGKLSLSLSWAIFTLHLQRCVIFLYICVCSFD
ncbi:hypothetical protein H8959_021300 [Pygathrix nigripes]